MDLDQALRLLRDRLAELQKLPPDPESQEFLDWRERAILAMDRIFGPYRTRSVVSVTFRSKSLDPHIAFETGRRRAEAVLKGAIFQLEELLDPPDFTSDAWADPELWEHVRYDVQDEEWEKVASQTAIFVESKIRQWAGLPESKYGKDLMVAVLRPGSGKLPLGKTPGEQEGWLSLGIGFASALGNVDRHRIQKRDDVKRYAMGVLGTGSVLLTQLRYEHGDRFEA